MEIKIIENDKEQFMELLLIGDEQPEMINKYLPKGTLFVIFDPLAVSIAVVTREDDQTVEIKNLATDPRFRGKGYASSLMRHIESFYMGKALRIQLGTGEVPFIMRFYTNRGYRISHRITDFFTHNYDHPIVENGVTLKDMIYFSKQL